jgi:XTP/dITP diphosphohydrolase
MGENTSYTIKNQAIIDAIEGKERTARFVCVIAHIDEAGKEHLYRGTMEGEINNKIEGDHGFGYDPIFYYPPFGTTNAMVDSETKNAHSHRGKALQLFLQDWNKQ